MRAWSLSWTPQSPPWSRRIAGWRPSSPAGWIRPSPPPASRRLGSRSAPASSTSMATGAKATSGHTPWRRRRSWVWIWPPCASRSRRSPWPSSIRWATASGRLCRASMWPTTSRCPGGCAGGGRPGCSPARAATRCSSRPPIPPWSSTAVAGKVWPGCRRPSSPPWRAGPGTRPGRCSATPSAPRRGSRSTPGRAAIPGWRRSTTCRRPRHGNCGSSSTPSCSGATACAPGRVISCTPSSASRWLSTAWPFRPTG